MDDPRYGQAVSPRALVRLNHYTTKDGAKIPCRRNLALFKDACLLLDYEMSTKAIGQPNESKGDSPDLVLEATDEELFCINVEYEDSMLKDWGYNQKKLGDLAAWAERAQAQPRVITDSIRDGNRNRLFVLNVISHNAQNTNERLGPEDPIIRILQQGPATVRSLLAVYADEEVRRSKLSSLCRTITTHEVTLVATPTGFLADSSVALPSSEANHLPEYLMPVQRFLERMTRHPLRLAQLGVQFPYAPGMRQFYLGGYRYEVLDDRTPERVMIQEKETGEVYRLTFESTPSSEGGESFMLARARDAANKTKRSEKALQRYDMISLLGDRPTKEDFENVARAVGKSARTLGRVYALYRKERTLSALGKPRKDAGSRRFSSVVESAMQRELSESYGKKPMSRILKDVKAGCAGKGVPEDQWPSLRTLYQRVHIYVERTKVLEKRFGKTRAENMLSVFTGTQVAEYPLHKVQIDCHQCDVITAYDYGGKRLVTGRPWLTLAKDRYSGKVLGFHVSLLDPTSYGAVFLTIADVALHHGRPSILVLDKGKVYRSDLLVMGCAENSIKPHWSREYTPQDKGAIERFFRTVEEGCFHYLDGTTYSNPIKRADYQSEKEAKHGVEEVEIALRQFCNEYNDRVPEGAFLSPNQKFVQGLSERGVVPYRIPANQVQRFTISFMAWAMRTIQKDGIGHLNMHFNGKQLTLLKRTDNKGDSIPYLIRWDPNDIRRVYIHDHERNDYYSLLNVELLGDPRFDPAQPVSLRRWRSVQHERRLGDPTSTLLHFNDRDLELTDRASKGNEEAAKELAAARKDREDRRSLGLELADSQTAPETSLEEYDLPPLDPDSIELPSAGDEDEREDD